MAKNSQIKPSPPLPNILSRAPVWWVGWGHIPASKPRHRSGRHRWEQSCNISLVYCCIVVKVLYRVHSCTWWDSPTTLRWYTAVQDSPLYMVHSCTWWYSLQHSGCTLLYSGYTSVRGGTVLQHSAGILLYSGYTPVQCTWYSPVHGNTSCVQCMVNIVQRTVYSVQCLGYNIECLLTRWDFLVW